MKRSNLSVVSPFVVGVMIGCGIANWMLAISSPEMVSIEDSVERTFFQGVALGCVFISAWISDRYSNETEGSKTDCG